MLYRYGFENFCSFRESAEISLVVPASKAGTATVFRSPRGMYLSRAVGVFGDNAVGKTSALKALAFVTWLALQSWRDQEPGSPIPFTPFAFSRQKRNSSFMLEFESEGIAYYYQVELNEQRIVAESLDHKESRRFSSLFKREQDNLTVNRLLLADASRSLIRDNATFLSVLYQSGNQRLSDAFRFLSSIRANVNFAGRRRPSDFESTCRTFLGKSGVFALAKKLLDDQFVLGVKDWQVKEVEMKNSERGGRAEKYATCFTEHAVSGKTYLLPLHFASSGTQHLFGISEPIASVMSEGGVAILDEFDVDLSPRNTQMLFDAFCSDTYNVRNGQFIFSCHWPYLMDSLLKHQIYIVEKDRDQCSSAAPLADYEGVRPDENFAAKFLAGAYGGRVAGWRADEEEFCTGNQATRPQGTRHHL